MFNPLSPELARLPILTFNLAKQTYGLLIEDVVEVTAMVEYTPLPETPDPFIGVINRRGAILPLLDLRLIFKQSAAPITSASLFIVAEGGSKQVGLVVDEVHQVEYMDALQLVDAPGSARYLHGMITHRSLLIPIVSLPALLTAFLETMSPEGF
jgi:purine-binding chemotaxis protein CheW